MHFFIRHQPFDVALLLPREGPKALANWKSWLRAFEVLGGERFPRRGGGLFSDAPYRLRLYDVAALVETLREGAMIILHDPLHHPNGCQPRQVRPSRCRCNRQAQPDEVMRRISDDGLIEIANLNLDFPPAVSDRAKIAHVAIAANPDSWPLGKRAAFQSFEPLVIANRIARARKRAGIGPS